jgi:hypothetical protein
MGKSKAVAGSFEGFDGEEKWTQPRSLTTSRRSRRGWTSKQNPGRHQITFPPRRDEEHEDLQPIFVLFVSSWFHFAGLWNSKHSPFTPGHETDPSTGAVAPPLVLSTTFERDTQNNTLSEYFYSRSGNPNRAAFEQACAALEGGAAAAAFASGQAATMSVLHALSSGDHLIAPTDIYYGTRALAETLYARWGLQASFVDTTRPRPNQTSPAAQHQTHLD